MVVDSPPDEEEIEGRTVYSYQFGNFNNDAEMAVHAVAVGEYVLLSQDMKAVKDYLNGPKKDAKPLRKLPGLEHAAAKVEALKVALLDLKTPELWLGPYSQYSKKIRACYPRLWVICLRVSILRPAYQ